MVHSYWTKTQPLQRESFKVTGSLPLIEKVVKTFIVAKIESLVGTSKAAFSSLSYSKR